MSGKKTTPTKKRAAEIAVDVMKPETGELAITTKLEGVTPVSLVSWLKTAVPAFMRSRDRLAKEAVAIGVALLAVRDFSPRGTLEKVKRSVSFGKSTRSLDRCIRMGQKFIKAAGLAKDGRLRDNHKVAGQVAGLFQSEFNFDESGDPLLRLISDHVGDSTMAELMEVDVLGADDAAMPKSHNGGREKISKDEQQRRDFDLAFVTFKQVWAGGREHLWNKDMIEVEVWLTTALDEVKKENKTRARVEASAAGRKP